jgi:hypothetical protein
VASGDGEDIGPRRRTAIGERGIQHRDALGRHAGAARGLRQA